MKKIICGFAAAVICISTALGASAENESAKIKLGVANKIADNGYEVTYRMLSDTDCAGVQGSLLSFAGDYNETSLSEAVAAKNNLNDSIKITSNNFGKSIRFSLLGDVKSGIKGELAEFKYTASDVADASTVGLSDFTAVVLNSGKPEKIDEYEIFMYGDPNGDEDIDIRDLVNLKKRIAANDFTDAADCNADGTMNSKDLVPLRQYLIGTVGASLG